MANIAFFCIPAQGHTNPTLGVVRELVRRGHGVRYWSYESLRARIEETGAEFIPCDGYDAQLALTPEQGDRLGSDLALSTRVLVETTLALDGPVCQALRDWPADLVVADSMAVWGKLAAQKLGLPYVCSTTTFAFNREAARSMKQGPGDLLRLLLALPRINRQLKRLRAAGYPVKNILEIIGADESAPNIVYTSKLFQPASDTFPNSTAFVGPSVRPPEGSIQKTRDRLVYISMGTVNNAMGDLYKNCIAALRDSGCQVILSLGDRVRPEDLGPLPDGFEAYPRVDQMAVLRQADLFLSHCGMNSVSESLWSGVPLVLLPQTPEQEAVANRAEALGAGLRLGATDPADIRAAVEAVLTDPSFKQNAQKLAADFRACPGAAGAADFIEALLRKEEKA